MGASPGKGNKTDPWMGGKGNTMDPWMEYTKGKGQPWVGPGQDSRIGAGNDNGNDADASRKRTRIGAGQINSEFEGAPGHQQNVHDAPVTFEQLSDMASKLMSQQKQAYKNTKEPLHKAAGSAAASPG